MKRDRRQWLSYARTVLRAEASAISSLEVGDGFLQAVDAVLACKGRVVTTAIGKPGFIAQKLSATLASVGVPSLYLHPAEAAHGDLGRVTRGDVVLALSNSGATVELVALLPVFKKLKATVVAITGDARSPLARAADVVIDVGAIDEACPIGLVPTTSSAALHAMSDALAMTVARAMDFTPERYARLHPAGTLGRAALRVSELMRTGAALPVVKPTAKLLEVVLVMTNTPGRPGAACVVGAKKQLLGIFTDGDLRRLTERGTLDVTRQISAVMGKRPRCVLHTDLVLTAASLMREVQVDQLPVVDAEGRLVGLLDVQDLL